MILLILNNAIGENDLDEYVRIPQTQLGKNYTDFYEFMLVTHNGIVV